MNAFLARHSQMRIAPAGYVSAMSQGHAAAHFRVGVSSAIRWVTPALTTGDIRPMPQGGDRRSAAIEAEAELILSVLGPEGDATLAEMRAALVAKGHSSGLSALSRFFAPSGIALNRRPRMRPNKSGRIS